MVARDQCDIIANFLWLHVAEKRKYHPVYFGRKNKQYGLEKYRDRYMFLYIIISVSLLCSLQTYMCFLYVSPFPVHVYDFTYIECPDLFQFIFFQFKGSFF